MTGCEMQVMLFDVELQQIGANFGVDSSDCCGIGAGDRRVSLHFEACFQLLFCQWVV